MIFSKENPSKEYIKLIEDYLDIHKKGTPNFSPKNTYNGVSTITFAEILEKIIKKNNYKTLLDYGSGKGDRYFNESSLGQKNYPPLKDFWQIKPTLFDPGVPYPEPYNKKFDITISIDVLEHIPYSDLGWVVNEIFKYASEAVFINVACYPSKAKLPNGKNAHVSLFDPMWWCGFISAIASKYNNKVFIICTFFKNHKKEYFSYSINDNFNNYQ